MRVYVRGRAQRMESSESLSSRAKLTEMEAQAAVSTEKLNLQLAAAQREIERLQAASTGEATALAAKVKQVKKLAQKERAAFKEAEAQRVRMLETMKREVQRLRGEREQLKRELGASPPLGLSAQASAGPMREDVRSLLAASVAAESAIGSEAAKLKAAAARA